MKLISLEVNNFRQFKGSHKIDFSTCDQKNVTVIHGENGVGKTALLNSIYWCFFGTTTGNFEQSKTLGNNSLSEKEQKQYSVTILFDFNGKEYRLHRTYKDFEVFEISKAGHLPLLNASAFIRNVIPSEMGPYFFFQGEGINKLDSTKLRDDVKQKIRNIMGYYAVEKAITDLEKIEAKFRRNASKVRPDKDIDDLTDKIEIFSRELAEKSRQYQNMNDEIIVFTELINTEKEKLKNYEGLSSFDIRKLEHKRSLIEKELKSNKTMILRLEGEKNELIKRYGWKVIGKKLADSIKSINNEELKGRIPAPYHETFIEELLESRICICGRPIKEHSSEYNIVKEKLKQGANETLIKRVSDAKACAGEIKSFSNERSFSEQEIRIKEQVFQYRKRNENREEEKEEISRQLLNCNEQEIRTIEKNIKDYDNSRVNLSGEKRMLQGQIENLEKQIKIKTRKHTEILKMKPAYDQTNRRIKAATLFRKHLKRLIEEEEPNIIRAINVILGKIISKYSRHDYDLSISEYYNLKFEDESGNQVAKSDGQRLLVNLAFISALINLANKRAKAQGEILTPGVVAPFVLDAPFGELDIKYQQSVAEFLPESANQVILLVSSSHWNGIEKTIQEKVGKEFLLTLHIQGQKGIKSDDLVKINDENYVATEYGCYENYTSINPI